jgi:pimeloyl-ACP methyl ester carboxylesterase
VSLFCLIHGSTQNPSGWNLLTPALEQLGHGSITVDLPTDTPEASAVVYADCIVRALPADTSDVVVVAHSASGIFLPLAVARKPVRRMIFLAAAIPKIGSSFLDQFQAEPDMLHGDWIGKDPTKDDAIAMNFLFHDCSADVAKWALSTRRLMFAKQAIVEKCPLDVWPNVPASYIVCQDDRTFSAEWSRRACRERLGVEPVEIPGGHCPHVSRPTELARILDAMAL